ncbi:stage II sporulation protein M [Micromonospora sp. WMMA1949]|uniref:stage II sporulation protein M n=1 Tax=unclassified Micromonospora TaxID=2617518 RepID=UPI0022B6B7DF|nr:MULTISPECIES: stage II sporulation protein M [unclassified Micromonospora]MCZ7425584.1 stage II sporulation protein M [Micromonospora sp. WMMA1949]WBC10137.1 stage II sporulation protein M [Micromonospora sp. WMMA1947]
MDLDAYVAEHGAEWRRLEHLTGRRRLDAAEVDELVALYQRTATHLSALRARAPEPALVNRLSHLVLAARARVTGRPRPSWAAVGRFLTADLPAALYRAWPWWCGVATAFSALSAFLIWFVASNPDTAAAFVGAEEAKQLVDSGFAGYYSEFSAPTFAFRLWTHNAWLAAQCLAAGVLVVPVFWLLWQNALNIGVVGGVMISYDRADVFFGMITPHGLLELTGIFVAAGVGLRTAWAWIAPPAHLGRGRALAEAGRLAAVVAAGLVGVFAVSALIEAFVTPAPVPIPLRVATGAAVWLAFLAYALVLGRRAVRAGRGT